MEKLFPGMLGSGAVQISKSESIVTFDNGSEILFEGLDPTRIDKVLGAQYATAWVNECNEIADYEIIQQLASRMADTAPMVNNGKVVKGPDGKPRMARPLMVFDCNPDIKGDWDHRAFQELVHPISGKPHARPEKWCSLFVPSTDNEANQAEGYLESLTERYSGSPNMEERFLHGQWRDDNPNALFRKSMFRYRVDIPSHFLVRIIVGVDPSGSNGNNSDYAGLVVVGLGQDGNAYVLEDGSLKGLPEQWAAKAVALYDKWDADCIIAERNYGGAMVESTIRQVRRNVPVKTVWASRGKLLRAEPVAMIYQQGKVFHAEQFKELEAQMCDYKPTSKKSPDRMDALVWALWELLKLGSAESRGFSQQKARGFW